MKRAANTDPYARIRLAPMNAIERQVGANALRDAEAIAGAIVWVVNGMRQLIAAARRVGGLKHSH